METFVKNKSFEIRFTLLYEDTGLPINLTDLDDIDVVIRHKSTKEELLTRTMSDSNNEVVIITAASGICAIYINGADTASADSGKYEAIITVTIDNSYFDDSTGDFAVLTDAFILID